jgi:CheY-like chemotaxis protein
LSTSHTSGRCSVITVAADGAAALAVARQLEQLDLVVSDLRMPHLDGLELGRQARALHARAAIVLLSGAPPVTAVTDRNLRILRKPFEWNDLREVVLSLLPAESPPAAELETPSPAASG